MIICVKLVKLWELSIVVFDAITEKHERGDERNFTSRLGSSTLKVWLVDVNNKQPILDAKEVIGIEQESIPIDLGL